MSNSVQPVFSLSTSRLRLCEVLAMGLKLTWIQLFWAVILFCFLTVNISKFWFKLIMHYWNVDWTHSLHVEVLWVTHSVRQCYITWTQRKELKVAFTCCFSGVLQVPVHTTEGQGPSGCTVPRRQDVLQLHGTSILHQHDPAGHRKPGWPRMGLPGRLLWNMRNILPALVSPKEIAFSKYVIQIYLF